MPRARTLSVQSNMKFLNGQAPIEKTEKTANRGMNPAQKVFVSGLQATNKPFEKVVPGKAKDTLGLVAIITVAISMATLGFYLVFGGNQY